MADLNVRFLLLVQVFSQYGVTQNYSVFIQSECSVQLYQHHYYLMFQKHENAVIQGQGHDDPSVLPDPVSDKTDDAVTAHSG